MHPSLGLVTVLLIVAAASTPAAEPSAGVTVQGRVTIRQLLDMRGNESLDERALEFTTKLSGDQWSIRIDSAFGDPTREVWTCDGTNVVMRLTVLDGDGWIKVKPETLLITPGLHPLGHVNANLIWLAFCSSRHLSQPGRCNPLPSSIIGSDPHALACVDVTERYPDQLALPRRVTWRMSHERYAKVALDPRLFRDRRVLLLKSDPKPIPNVPDGFRLSDYEVLETADRAPAIPTRFEYLSYVVAGGVEGLVKTRFEGVVTNVLDSVGVDAAFQPGREYRITDRRFRAADRLVDGITYEWAEDHFPDVDDPDLKRVYEREYRDAAPDPNPGPTQGNIRQVPKFFRVLLAVTSLGGILLMGILLRHES